MDNNQNNDTRYVWWWVGGIVLLALIIGGTYFLRDDGATDGDDTDNATSTVESTMILPYGNATLGLGQTASFRGITITPVSLSEDSRCAQGVQCIQAGTVRVNVRATYDNGASVSQIVRLGQASTFGTFSVNLTAVEPAQRQNVTIRPEDYRFTFRVTQSAGVQDDLQGLEAKG